MIIILWCDKRRHLSFITGKVVQHGTKSPLLSSVREKLRVKHYNIRTEKTVVTWIKRFIFYHNKRHPVEMGKGAIEQFLT